MREINHEAIESNSTRSETRKQTTKIQGVRGEVMHKTEFDLLVAEVFFNIQHPLNEILKNQFGHDQGTEQKIYSCSMAELRNDLIKLGYDKEVKVTNIKQ